MKFLGKIDFLTGSLYLESADNVETPDLFVCADALIVVREAICVYH